MFADYAYERLLQKGYSPHAAAAAVGAFQQESGDDLDPQAVHDNGTGFGIAGWRDPKPGEGRKTNLFNWAGANGLDPNDIDTQIDFFDYETTEGDEASIGEMLRNAETVDDAAAAMVHYERPEGYDESDVTKASGYENRLGKAKALFESYAGGDAAAAVGIESPDDTLAESSAEEDDLDFIPFDDGEKTTDEDLADENKDDEKQTTGQRIGKAIYTASRSAEEAANEDSGDYTPNMEIEPLPETGIPVNSYQQYVPMYKNGGVVGEADINEYFKMLGI